MQSQPMPAASVDTEDFYNGLVKYRLIIPGGVDGAFGRGAAFEKVLEAFNGLISRISSDDGAESCTFPPVIDRRIIERVKYMDSFPDLCGAVCSFMGKEPQARELSERINSGKPWGDALEMTQVVLNPAACYPLYPTLTGVVPEGGRTVTMLNWVFRHEPSREPTRMQSFRVREFVRIGDMEAVVAWRDLWLARRPKVHLHHTPTHASWLNPIEIWFSILSGKSLNGASFQTVEQLKAHINAFIADDNEQARAFAWTKARRTKSPSSRVSPITDSDY